MRHFFVIVVLCLAAGAIFAADRKDSSAVTMTGILDQQGEDFVLSGEDAMRTKAILRASGFSPDNFARFVGERVEVRGELQTEGDRRILVVKRLEDLRKIDRTSP